MNAALSTPNRIRVLLLFGGRSGEHPISCATAAAVMRALDPARYDVLPVGVTTTGRWVQVPLDPGRFEIRDQQLAHVPPAGEEVLLPADAVSRELRVVRRDGETESLGRVDVVFPLLHGSYGEDGTLQGALELLDLPYVGSGVFASAAGMDKHFMKIVFESAGLPVAPSEVITRRDWLLDREACLKRAREVGFPLFVKPSRAGSSLGISKVFTPEELTQAIIAAQKEDPKVLLEQQVVGREIEVAVLQGRNLGPARATDPGEIRIDAAKHEFYDFDAKYLDTGDLQLDTPANVPAEAASEARSLAIRAFDALECEGLARVDFFYREDGSLIINEINTMPGFTPFSMYPQLWQAAGMTYPELLDELIALALERPTGLR